MLKLRVLRKYRARPLAPAVDGEKPFCRYGLDPRRHAPCARHCATGKSVLTEWPGLHVGIETPDRSRLIKIVSAGARRRNSR